MATFKDGLNKSYSLATSFNSDTWDVTDLRGASIQVVWTGANATDGTLVPQVSNDNVTFDDADTPPPTLLIAAASGSRTCGFDLQKLSVRYIRLVFAAGTNTAGTLNVRTWGLDKNLGYK